MMTKGKAETVEQIAERFQRTVRAVRSWKAAGCPGFDLVDGDLHCDPGQIESWLVRTKRLKPDEISGPKASSHARAPARAKGEAKVDDASRGQLVAFGGDQHDHDDSSAGALTRARIKKERALALKHELGARQLSGELIRRDDARAAMGKLAALMVARLQALPARISSDLAAARGVGEVRALLEAAIDSVRREVADELGNAGAS